MARLTGKPQLGMSTVPGTIDPSPTAAVKPPSFGPKVGGAMGARMGMGKVGMAGKGGPGPLGRMKSPTATRPRKRSSY